MRVLIAPDKFAGTLSAVDAAEAIATGWSRHAPADELMLVPLSDGGPGFVDILYSALGGSLRLSTVPGPLGEPTPATWLLVDGTAYIEAAQACGLGLVPPRERRPLDSTTRGVGELLRAALDGGATRVVVGVGGTASTDGGAGLIEALGMRWPDGVDLILASDVESPLLGVYGAARMFGPQKGASDAEIEVLEGRLTAWA
ncbi:MAG: glycerate kinase, partial [Candidatus Nanopelagicales bacterium]